MQYSANRIQSDDPGEAVMNRSRGGVLAAAASVGMALAITACGGGSSSSSTDNPGVGGGDTTATPAGAVDAKAPPKGDLTFAVAAYPSGNDVYANFDTNAVAAWRAWWEYLVRPTKDSKGFEGRLAEKFTKSPDSKTYTFNLRRGVKFSNGDPFTAADVLFSWNKAFTTETSNLTFLHDKIKSMTAPDPYTVKVVFKQPWPYFLADVCCHMSAILPAKLVKREGYRTYIKRPVGTGPFVYDKVNAGSSLELKRNPSYWEKGYPKLNSLTFAAFADDSARATAVQGGRANIAESPPPNQLSTLKSSGQVQVEEFPSARVDNIAVNTKRKPLNNEDVRRAISLGIDRAAIVKAGLFGTGKPANTFLVGPSSLTYQDTSADLYPYDPAQAKKLVAASGLKTPIKVDMAISDGTVQTVIGQVVKANLKPVGIDVTLKRSDLNSTEAAIGKEDYQLSTTFWANYQPDPTIQPLFAIDPDYCCDAYLSGYDDKANIKQLKEAIAATDEGARREQYAEVQKRLAQDAHLLPLFFPTLTYVTGKDVAGFFAYPNNLFAYEQWQLK